MGVSGDSTPARSCAATLGTFWRVLSLQAAGGLLARKDEICATGPRIGLHGYLKPLKKLYLHYQPLGVVGVITLGCGELTFVMPSR